MRLENSCVIPADQATAWALIMDIPKAAACVPGLKEITPDGENRFKAVLQVRVGPMGLNFTGTVMVLETDEDRGEARIQVEAADRRVGGSIKADMTVKLTSAEATGGGSAQTRLSIITETAFMGKLGELGQPLMRRKAATTIEEFAKNLAKIVPAP
jgi:carbon monoxide dehydrogenase subunit G